MSGPYLSVQSYLGLNKEATRGTAPAWTTSGAYPLWVPVEPNPALNAMQTWQEDKSLRGSPVDLYDDVPLTRHDEYDFKGYVYCDTFPGLLLALLGGPDTAGTSAPYTHTIPLLNAAESGSQPPSFSGADVDLVENLGTSVNAKQFTGSQLSELTLDFAATGALGFQAKFIANPYTQIAKPSSSFSTEILIPAYNGAISFGGSQSYVVEKGQLALKRNAVPIFTIGQQGPYRNWAGPMSVAGSFELLVLADDLTQINGLTYFKQAVTLTFTDPVSAHSVFFQMSRVQFKDPKIVRDQPYVRATVSFAGEANSTDATSGYSPITTRVTNAVSSAY